MLYAHDWEILKGQRIRRWTNNLKRQEQVKPQVEDPRRVTVTLSSWVGTSPGARHYYVKIEEEQNQWWCEDRSTWVKLSCDSTSNGFSLRADCYSPEEALELAKFTVNLIFGRPRTKKRKMWRIHWDDRF
jgi:hypothetical protein